MSGDDFELSVFLDDQSYLTCSECGSDCVLDPFVAGEGEGIRIAFICPSCGVQSVIDPFEDLRQTTAPQTQKKPRHHLRGR